MDCDYVDCSELPIGSFYNSVPLDLKVFLNIALFINQVAIPRHQSRGLYPYA